MYRFPLVTRQSVHASFTSDIFTLLALAAYYRKDKYHDDQRDSTVESHTPLKYFLYSSRQEFDNDNPHARPTEVFLIFNHFHAYCSVNMYLFIFIFFHLSREYAVLNAITQIAI